MFKTQIISKVAAAFMLVMFAFSITPTIVFHNWLANHTDTCKKSADTNAPQLGNKTFNCHCDNMVAESPFTETETFAGVAPIQIYLISETAAIAQLPRSLTIFHSLRGPPLV